MAMADNELSSTRRIVNAIKSIPAGKVSSYRDVALAAGVEVSEQSVVDMGRYGRGD
jgi:alkylated DNA nucleotide flippase Atl1